MRWKLAALLLVLTASPAGAQTHPDRHKAEVDALIAALKQAPDESAAMALEARIRQLWLQSGTPAVTLLMTRGVRDLTNDADAEALDDFNAVLALDPDLPDAYHRRALARFGLGDYVGALADIEAALQREPRDFAAMESLSQIAEARGDYKGALSAWQKVLELSPKTPDGQGRLRLLTRKALGEST